MCLFVALRAGSLEQGQVLACKEMCLLIVCCSSQCDIILLISVLRTGCVYVLIRDIKM